MSTANILIADDQDTLLDMYVQSLDRAGIAVDQTFANGIDLSNYLANYPGPNVVVVDHVMPIKTGLSVIHDCKQDESQNSNYFILVTGDLKIAESAHDLGADFTLVKPFKIHKLVNAIRVGLRSLRFRK